MTTGKDEGDRYAALRTRAIESLLIEKGLLSEQAVDVVVEAYGSDIGPLHGARVVARAWTDPAFKERLLEDATAAARELGRRRLRLRVRRAPSRTPRRQHNLVVCTLCSCYPWGLLGLPPAWYKSPEYRARAVREPRAVLREFGVELDDETEIRIWDSSADLRYIVLPRRPEGTDGLSGGRARGPRHARVDDRHRSRAVARRHEQRRRSRELAGWKGSTRAATASSSSRPRGRRARFGVAVALCERQGIGWEADFRSRLIDEIGAWEREHGCRRERLGSTTSAGSAVARAPRARARARGRRGGRGARWRGSRMPIAH